MEQEISLLDLWNLFRKYFVRIAGMTIIGAALAVAFMLLFVDRKYESEAQLLVNQSSGQETAMQYSELQSNVYLINTYTDIIQGDAVLTAVNESLGNHFKIGELRDAISVTQSQNSQAFYITATMESPVDAQNIVNSIITEFENTLMAFYGDDVTGIYVMSSASYNPNPVSPSIIMYALIGGMLGFIIMAGIALVKELMDTRVKSVDDLTNMGLIRLGEINELTNAQVKKNRYRIESDKAPLRRRV
ncbi:MAG TPA: LPS chain length-determining protein [Aerococcaceae bacterium]|nr:LPS chain length-determining protein [Aerococcaceae bacterium]